MRMGGLYKVFGLAVAFVLLFFFPSKASENPKERIDYWQENYEELLPDDDQRVSQVKDIFKRVLKASGTRLGVVPRLFLINHNSLISAAIPDGWIVLSKGVLDLCYKDPIRGADRLAFVLAHEIAHQLKDDFWHMRFFQAIELSRERDPRHQKTLDEVQGIASLTDKVLAKELQADEHGIIYASLAGFNANAIVTEDEKVNFFEEWVRALDLARVSGVHMDPSHPSPKQRAEAVKARLIQVLSNVELFDLGFLFYQAGDYHRAILAFKEFLRYFPGREVYHNLAISHHQLALKYYRRWKGDEEPIPFKLSLTADPHTRATEITLRSRRYCANPAALFQMHIESAIELYEKAILLDPSYLLSYSNLGSALIVKGEFYEAIAKLKKALRIDENYAEALNNLGVAFFCAENLAKAKDSLFKAHNLNPAYDAPLFNLGKIAYEEKKEVEAKKYWTAYLKLDPASPWSDVIYKTLSLERPEDALKSFAVGGTENIMGLEAGAFEDDVPSGWGKPCRIRSILLEEEPFVVAVYNNGVMTLSQVNDILMIVVPDGYVGKSARGISIGVSEKEVLARYGTPSKVLNMTRGTSLVYYPLGITFQLREGKVVSWLLF